MVTNVYGTMESGLRSLLWSELRRCEGPSSRSLVYKGRFAWESGRRRESSFHMEKFLAFPDSDALVVIPLVGSRFTWARGSALAPSMSRIDRLLMSEMRKIAPYGYFILTS